MVDTLILQFLSVANSLKAGMVDDERVSIPRILAM